MSRLRYVLCWGFFLLAGCGKETPHIRIAANVWAGYEHLFLAKSEKFFERAGVSVDLIEYGSLGDVRRAFEWDQVDGIACSLVDVFMLNKLTKRNLGVVLIPSYPLKNVDVILAHPDIKSVAALKGKHVGVEVESLGIYMLARALEMLHMTLNDVVMVPADPSEMCTLIKNKVIDAAVCYAPYSSVIERELGYKNIFSSSQIPHEIIDVIAVDESIIKNDPQLIQKIVNAWSAAFHYAQTYPKYANPIMAERQHLPLSFFEHILGSVRILSPKEQVALFVAQEKYWENLNEQVAKHLVNAEIVPNAAIRFSKFYPQFIQNARL